MTTEMTKQDPAYLEMWGADTPDEESYAADGTSRLPMLKMSDGVFVGSHDKQPLPSIGGAKLNLLLFHRVGGRSLWAPQGHERKQPICKTGELPIAQIPSSRGKWLDDTGEFRRPELADMETCEISCMTCPYNRFGTMAKHDSARATSRGKACGESRLFFAMLVRRKGSLGDYLEGHGHSASNADHDFGIYKPIEDLTTSKNPYGVVLIRVSMGSSKKSVESLVSQVNARPGRFPHSSAVFRCGVEVKSPSPGVSFDVLEPELVGVLSPDVFRFLKEEALPWCEQYLNSMGNRDDEDIGSFWGEAGTESETGGESESGGDFPGDGVDPAYGF